MDGARLGRLVAGPRDRTDLEAWLRNNGAQHDAVGYLYSGLVEAYAAQQWPQFEMERIFARYRLLQPSCASLCHARREELVDWLVSLDSELFLHPSVRVDMRRLVESSARDPRAVRLPLGPTHLTHWLLHMLPQAVIWVCARFNRAFEKGDRPPGFAPFEDVPEEWFVLESYPLVLVHLLLSTLEYLADPNAANALALGSTKTIHYGWVASAVQNMAHPQGAPRGGGGGFPYVSKPTLCRALRLTGHIHRLRAPSNRQYWPYAHAAAPFKRAMATLATEETPPPHYRLPAPAPAVPSGGGSRSRSPALHLECFEQMLLLEEGEIGDMVLRPADGEGEQQQEETPATGSGGQGRSCGGARAGAATGAGEVDDAAADEAEDDEDGGGVFLAIDAGSTAFKCLRGVTRGDDVLEVQHYPSAASRFDTQQHVTSSVFLNVQALREDAAAWRRVQACDGVHPRSLIAADVVPEASPFAQAAPALVRYLHRYEGVQMRREMDPQKYLELRAPKAFCMSGEAEVPDGDDDGRVFSTPAWIGPAAAAADAEEAVACAWPAREPFYQVDDVELSAFFVWALYVYSWFEGVGVGARRTTAAVLVPNIMKRVEMTYTEYAMKAALHQVGIRDVLAVPEGSAEAFRGAMDRVAASSAAAAADGDLSVCIVAGGCTGDVTLSQSGAGGWRTVFKSTYALEDASSIRLNHRLTRRILGMCDRQALAEHYDWMVEQGRFGVTTAAQAERAFREYVHDVVDSLKHQIETNFRYDILDDGGAAAAAAAFPLRRDVYGFVLDVRLSIHDVYVPELLVSIDVSVGRAVDFLEKFYAAYPSYGPVTNVHFSGGVFQSAAGVALASRRLVALAAGSEALRPRLRWTGADGEKARSGFGAGCLGALGMMMELRRQATGMGTARIAYERSEADVEHLRIPRLHAGDVTSERQWRFEVRARGGGRDVVSARTGEEVRVPCASYGGVAFLQVVALKSGCHLFGSSCHTHYYYYSDDVVEMEGAGGGFDALVRTQPILGDTAAAVLVTCRMDALRRRVVVTVRSEAGAAAASVHTHPMWITYAFPGCCNQWRTVARLRRLAALGMKDTQRGVVMLERIQYMTERVLNNAAEVSGRRFVDAMWTFLAWMLEEVPTDVLHRLCEGGDDGDVGPQRRRLRLQEPATTSLPPPGVAAALARDPMEHTLLMATVEETEVAEEGKGKGKRKRKRTVNDE